MTQETYIEMEHPGIMLKQDFLDDLDIKPGTLARKIGVDRTAVKKIIEGQRSITADMALRLGLFFNMSPEFWLTLQAEYDLRKARKEKLSTFESIILPMNSLGTDIFVEKE